MIKSWLYFLDRERIDQVLSAFVHWIFHHLKDVIGSAEPVFHLTLVGLQTVDDPFFVFIAKWLATLPVLYVILTFQVVIRSSNRNLW